MYHYWFDVRFDNLIYEYWIDVFRIEDVGHWYVFQMQIIAKKQNGNLNVPGKGLQKRKWKIKTLIR